MSRLVPVAYDSEYDQERKLWRMSCGRHFFVQNPSFKEAERKIYDFILDRMILCGF